jgi:hypothetical protein
LNVTYDNGSWCYTFNLKDEFILYGNWEIYDRKYHKEHKIIWIYSTQTKNNKWACKRIYKIPEYFELINISKYDKLYLFSNSFIYEWDLDTKESIKIFCNEEVKEENKVIQYKLFENVCCTLYN